MNELEVKDEIERFLLESYVIDEGDTPIAANGDDRAHEAKDAERLARDLFSETRKIGIDPSSLRAKRQTLGDEFIDDAGRGEVAPPIAMGPDEALQRLSRVRDVRPECSLRTFSSQELSTLISAGRVARFNIFDEDCAKRMPAEIDRLIDHELILQAKDRETPDGIPLEWITSQGAVWDSRGRESNVLTESAPLMALYEAMIAFAESYNRLVEKADVQNVPTAIAPEGIELNVNCVVGGPAAQWSGLHPHQDMLRFTDGLRALPPDSIRHTAVKARALTISVYFRRDHEQQEGKHSTGGGLTFEVPEHARRPGELNIFDFMPADHNTGAIFLPSTRHGVARMPIEPDIRYSAQAFFPDRTVWESEIKPRIDSGEIVRELQQARDKR